MTVKERIRLYAEALRIPKSTLEKEMGMSKGSLGNDSKINADAVSSLLDAHQDLSAEWLMLGKPWMSMRIDSERLKEEMINVMQNNGVNTGTMSNSTKSNDYSVLLKEKDERISELKERIAELKETIELLKSK